MIGKDYTFQGLGGGGEYVTSLAYLVALVPGASHVFRDEVKDWVLAAQYDFEEQARSPADLLEGERLHMPDGVFPQTPVMITKSWSPLGSVLERGLEPKFLRRHEKPGKLAVGIWSPRVLADSTQIGLCRNDEQLFWAIFDLVCTKAIERDSEVCILAEPGWSYERAIGSLQSWSAKQITKADRVLWKRTSEG